MINLNQIIINEDFNLLHLIIFKELESHKDGRDISHIPLFKIIQKKVKVFWKWNNSYFVIQNYSKESQMYFGNGTT
ncbi:hypothetical protein PIROE2DRAFT_8904 [Piromyces sp. E2]|nr:hypothetical protein PIROE2DRAFT_8904 [Piromyces sp. E2]|eukprot:OUM64350.1 hypothetical protein PIROE2DRAFT_8904 [Piromyces sp. E2]